MPDDMEWLAQSIAARLTRIESEAAREKEIIRRSYEQLALSEKLLSVPVPKVWHPEPPQ